MRTLSAPTRPDEQPACTQLGIGVFPGGQVKKGTTVQVTVTGAPGATVELRAWSKPSLLEWLKAILTGQADGTKPWKVVGTAKAGADGRAAFDYKASADTLLHARQPGCRWVSKVAVVDVK